MQNVETRRTVGIHRTRYPSHPTQGMESWQGRRGGIYGISRSFSFGSVCGGERFISTPRGSDLAFATR